MKNYLNKMMKPRGASGAANEGGTSGQSKERKIRHWKGLLAAGEIDQAEYNRRVQSLS